MPKKNFDQLMLLMTDAMFSLLQNKTNDAARSLRLAISFLEDEQLKARQKGCRYD